MPHGAFQHPMVNPAHFGMQPRAGVPRSAFDTLHFHKTTLGAGQLVPIYCEEVLPGDSLSLRMSALVRLAPMLVPAMDNLALHSWFFFVPNRLVWDHWDEFWGASTNPTVGFAGFQIPTITDFNNASLQPTFIGDYFGITNNHSGSAVDCSALPFRGYNLIYNEWFRDPALVVSAAVSTGDGPDSQGSYIIQPIAKAKDYFTTARPYPAASPEYANSGSTLYPEWGQLTQVAFQPGGRMTGGAQHKSFGVGAPVSGLGVASGAAPSLGATAFAEASNRTQTYNPAYTTGATPFLMAAGGGNFPDVRVMVEDIRQAVMIQRYMELDQRFGNSYVNKVWAHFGVRTGDARLQRPEFLGGGRSMVTINPVLQTAGTTAAAPQPTVLAQLAATGYAAARGHGFTYSFPEHGYVIGLIGIRGDRTYQQGVARHWMRRLPFDFYSPETAHLGEQAILSGEIFRDGTANDGNVFGYQERWAEYRTRISRTSGFMRSTAATPIDMWHFADLYGTGAAPVRPVLNATFLSETPNGVIRALQSSAPYSSSFFGDFMFSERHVRPLPMFSIPGVGGRL